MLPPTEYFISPLGDDVWSGLVPDPTPDGADGPLCTLEAARDVIRRVREREGLPAGGVTVWLRGGEYGRTATFALRAEDSGTAEAPIVYRAWPGEAVRLLGGRRLEPAAFTPVTDPGIRARLTAEVREAVVQIDLRAQGVREFGAFASRGFSRPTTPAHLELFVDDRPMTVAQWPDAGEFATITGFSQPRTNEWGEETGDLAGGFSYESDRPRGWAPSDDIWAHGYWAWDWANSYERVRRLDPVAQTVEMDGGLYSFRRGQRFYFLNVLEELDAPGEFFVDRAAGMLYLWPAFAGTATAGKPAPLAGAVILVSELADPFIALTEVSHVTFCDLTLEAGRGSGVRIEGGEGVCLTGCTLRNLGNWGVIVDGGLRHTIVDCAIYGVGDGGVDVQGGDRATLTPCNHQVLHNHIHHYARWSRCYVAGINAGGVGMRIAHNLIHDAPHNAILFWGNDFLIEDNEIARVCLETGDAGAIYTGRDYTFRGNVIRRNFIHHMGGVGMGSIGVYMDDCVSGTQIVENIFWECQFGLLLGGGRDFRVEHNLFIDCRLPIHADTRGIDPNPVWQTMVNTTMRARLEAMRHHEPPYSARYPEIAGVDPHLAAGTGVPPEHNRVEGNIFWSSGAAFHLLADGAHFDRNLYWCATGPVRFHGCGDWADWQARGHEPAGVVADPRFVDPAHGDFRLRADSPALALGIVPFDLSTAGVRSEVGEKS
jgi:hypothetical protein